MYFKRVSVQQGSIVSEPPCILQRLLRTGSSVGQRLPGGARYVSCIVSRRLVFSPGFRLCTGICGKLVAGLFSCLFIPYAATPTKDGHVWGGRVDGLSLVKTQAVAAGGWRGGS